MLRNFVVLALVVFALAMQVQSIGRMQSTSVHGRVTCNGKPEIGLRVKMVDHDTFTVNKTRGLRKLTKSIFKPSDRMAEGVTDQNGEFTLAGHKSEISNIVAEVRMYHKCGHFFFRHCSKFRVPSEYITAGRAPESTYEAGEIKLETMTSNC